MIKIFKAMLSLLGFDMTKQSIGFARLDAQNYEVIRQGANLFLCSLPSAHHKENTKLRLKGIPTSWIREMSNVRITLFQDSYVMIGNIRIKHTHKTFYATSKDARYFTTQSLVPHPDPTPVALVESQDKKACLITSIDGELVYRLVNPYDKEISYHKCNVGPRGDAFDHAPLSVVHAENINEGIFVIYDASFELRGYRKHIFGACLLNEHNLSEVIWRATWEQSPYWEQFITKKDADVNTKILGGFIDHQQHEVNLFFVDDQHEIYTLSLHEPFGRKDPRTDKAYLHRSAHNPIVCPESAHQWENHNTFNPTALVMQDEIHLLYRAEGEAGLSVIGYGKSSDGYQFKRLADPVYVPRLNFEGVGVPKHMMTGRFKSGYRNYEVSDRSKNSHQWHGVEDPRVTVMENRIVMIYAAYNGYQMARPAITSISIDDFKAQNWNWSIPQPMTPQAHFWGDGNKNVVLHPKKVHGKYMIYHRIWPHIRIDYVDDLDFGSGKKWLKEVDRISVRGDSWDSERVGVSACPIEIDEGWLLIYQGSGSQDRRYKIGAMILDKEDPSKVLYRSHYPILAPEEWYENENKAGVAYPCGAVIHGNMLKVYYGGSDRYVCVAEANLRDFIELLKQDRYEQPQLNKLFRT